MDKYLENALRIILNRVTSGELEEQNPTVIKSLKAAYKQHKKRKKKAIKQNKKIQQAMNNLSN